MRPTAGLGPAVVFTLLALALPAGATATTIPVTTTADDLADDGLCSLREAITAANNDVASSPTAGECPAGDSTDTITLGANTYALTRGGLPDDLNDRGDLDVIGTSLTIAGAGAGATTIDASAIPDRVLEVRPNRILTLRGVTITGGHAPNGSNGIAVFGGPGANATGGLGSSGAPGGGILNAGVLTITDSTIAGNTAGTGGIGGNAHGGDGATAATGGNAGFGMSGNAGNGGDGGGIYTTGTLTLTRMTVTGNNAGAGGPGGTGTGGQGGGGISGAGGAGGFGLGGDEGDGGFGGGIYEASGGLLTIDQSTISGNHAGAGGAGGLGQGGVGGVSNGSGPGGVGGGGHGGDAGSAGRGGGVAALGDVTMTGSLVEDNTSGAGGAGGNGVGAVGGHSFGTGAAGGGGDAVGGGGRRGGAGGGVFVQGGSSVNSTIIGNSTGAGGDGGNGTGGKGGNALGGGTGGHGGSGQGLFGGNGGDGGGISDSFASTTIRHDTLSFNNLGSPGAGGAGVGGAAGSGTGGAAGTATNGFGGGAGSGGALWAEGGATVAGTIAAANEGPSCGGFSITNGGHNITFPDVSCPGANVDPLLAPLAANGGRTMTQALGVGSPALDAVPASGAGCPATDQRTVLRPGGPACDIGAFELAAPGVLTGDASPVTASGATLAGQVTPNGRTANYHFEVGQTTAYGVSTPAQSAGAGVDPVGVNGAIQGLAPGTTYHYRLVATSSDGTTNGADRTFTTPGAGGTSEPPAFLSASLSRKVFAVNRRWKAEVPVAAVKRGTVFRYTLSEAARVVFTIQRALPGRRVRGVCRRPTRTNRSKPACKRYVRVGRFAAQAVAGANKKKFSGRIGRRTLRPGSYRATLIATNVAGKASKPKRLAFRVVRR